MPKAKPEICPKCQHSDLLFDEKDKVCQWQISESSVCGCHCKRELVAQRLGVRKKKR